MTILSHFNKGIAALAFSAMALTLIPMNVFASLDFTDSADIPTWATEAIEELVSMDVLSGNDNGSFAPARQLVRAEVAKIITLASGVDMDTVGGPHFPDVDEDAWFYDYVETMYNYGWIDGYPDGRFGPGNGINRAEIAKMVVNALELDLDTTGAPHFDDVSSNDWFFDYVETAYNYDLMRGYADGTFGANNPVTRAETAKIVYDGLLAVTTPGGPAEGTLELSLSYETPRGTNVPYNATSVPYTTIELTASDDSDVEVSAVTFTRLGLGDNDDFNNVWMEIDGFKVGNDKSINNDDIVELRFNPPIVVPAGQTLVADIVASAKYATNDHNIGHHNRLALVSADDVASTAMNVVGDFPIEGEEMEVADYLVSEIDFSELGSDTTIDVGDNFIEIGKFRMLNESTTNKDIELRAITFKNDGTAELENVLENVALYVSGEQVSAESIIDGDYVTFRLDNGVTGGYILEDGDSRIFSLRADIVSAEKGDTIKFKVDNYEDIVAIEIGTSFGVKATNGAFDAEDANATLREYSIDSGDINVSRDPSSLGNQQYAPGSNDIVAMTARIIVDQPLLVDGISLTAVYTGTATADLAGANAAFSNFRLFLNDNLVDSENSLTAVTVAAGALEGLAYDTTFEIAGASILKLVMNIQDGAPTDATIKFSVASADFSSPEYISTGDQVPTAQLLGSAQGSLVEVTESVLTITQTDGLSTETIVAGLDDVTFLEFVLDNNDSGDVNVTSLSVLGTGTDAANAYGNYTAAIFVDGTQQGSSKNLSSTTGAATFNDLSVVIPSAGQKEFAVVLNTSEILADGPAIAAVKQEATVTIGSVDNAGDQFNVIIDGTTFATVGAGATDNAKAIELAALVNANGLYDVAAPAAGTFTIVAATAGTAYTVDSVAVTATLGAAGETITTANTVANVVASGADDTLRIDITAVDADNVENGQTVTTTNATVAIATNNLTGAMYTLVTSGTLTVSGSPLTSEVLIGGTTGAEVLKIQLEADDDDVQIKDLYLKNTTSNGKKLGAGVNFNLYNEAGQLVQTKQMAGLFLHFELANQDRITVPKDGSTFVTIRVDMGDISDVANSAKVLELDLDTADATGGVEALTAATGSDIATPTSWGTAEGDTYVAYRSRLTLDRVTPTSTVLTSGIHQELFRFMVTADSAGAVKLDEVTLTTTLTGTVTGGTYTVEDASDDAKTYTITAGVIDFANLLIPAGTSKTYVLFGTLTGSVDNDSVSTVITGDATLATTGNIEWEDGSASDTSDLTNGYLLQPDKTATVLTK